jgi:polyhydroxybutyrate depolymerase
MRFRRGLAGLVAASALLAASAASASPALAAGGKKSCSISSPTGLRTIPLSDQGRDRPFLLFVPRGYDGHRALPLVLNLHGSGSNGAAQMEISQMAAEADRRGVAVAAPNGAVVQGTDSYAWNVPGVPLISGSPIPPGTPSDETYLLHVVAAAKKSMCIDSKRVSIAGYSGGARMASQMACDYSKKVASISPVAGLRAGVPMETSPDVWAPDLSTCRPAEPVAVQTFHGTADGTNPYLGNDDARWGYSVDAALARWGKLDRCKRKRTSQATPTVTRIAYDRCAGGATVTLNREEGAGHTWPGSSFPNGPIDTSLNATQMIVKFAKANSLADRG